MGVPLIKVKGITKEKEKVPKALRLKEKDDEPECEHLAEGEEWADYQNQEDWPDNEATYEEPGEQGAICVGEGLSAVSARAKAASRAAQKLQKDFETGKLWKRPQNFWCMPWKLVCQESRYKGTLVCGYQGCWRNNKAFRTENSYKQHLWSKVGTEGHPNRMQLDAWELRDYLVPHGQKPYPLWDQALGKIKDVDPASSDDEVLHRAQAGGGGCVKLMDKQKEKMRERLLYGPPDQEGEGGEEEDPPESDDSVSEFTVKSDYNVTHDVISDEEVERKKTSKLSLTPTSKAKAIERSKESKAKEKKDPRPPLPRLRKEEKKEKKEKKEKEDERPPIERRVPAKGKGKGSVASARPALSKGTSKGKDKDSAVPARQFVTPKPVKEPRAEGYEGDDSDEESPAKPMSSRPSKSARSDDLIGFTPAPVAVFSQNLVFQRLEEIKQLENAFAVLAENNPAKKHLRETINHLEKEVEDLKAEKAKSKPASGRKHSARQESDKKVAGARVAYIKEKQRRREANVSFVNWQVCRG